MQQKAYDIIREHNESPFPKSPLLLIIAGMDGTGKSFLIHSLRQYLKEKSSIAAPTGKASYNVKGVTIHSLLKLPVGHKGHCDLKGQILSNLQEQLRDIEYVIIDEYSMLGQNMFGWIDKRLQQITGYLDTIFGGKSVILIGNPCQLPPVGDKPLHHSLASNDIGLQGQFNYYLFDKVVKLSVNHRVTGQDHNQVRFRELLNRLRTGNSTKEDWKLLLTRQPSNVDSISEFDDAVRLFSTMKMLARTTLRNSNSSVIPLPRLMQDTQASSQKS